jgi:hypothetical protein
MKVLPDARPTPAEVELVNVCDAPRVLRLMVGLTQRLLVLEGPAVCLAALVRLGELVKADPRGRVQ